MEEQRMLILDFHREYKIPVGIKQVIYDGFNAETLLHGAGIRGPEAEKIIRKGMKGILEKEDWVFIPEVIKELQEELEPEIYLTIHRLHLSKDELEEWGKGVIEKASQIGGDDDYFDYFPNYLDMFRQACEAFGDQNLWEGVRDKVIETIDNDESDLSFRDEALYQFQLK